MPATNLKFKLQLRKFAYSAVTFECAIAALLRKMVKKFSGDWPKEISGVLVMERNGLRTGIEVKLPVGRPSSGR